MGTRPGVRDNFIYFSGQSFGAVHVKNFKFLFTAKDSWLGTDKPLKVVATYDLLWDPAEHYDMTFIRIVEDLSKIDRPESKEIKSLLEALKKLV